ncbi:hypothetical protein Q4583_09800 [Neptunomonas phycophila]|uniref:AtuA-like ferredoxin-fold domain-containing protein n=1 Tax=Neptunomonas phycophila TaxID=1572645 RepID=A0AAW7XIE1_9GAMM|nr:hypothetical protein [Neptunomonas phycophila]MBT3145634.1 hypothetical protein [Neptunomonas phycophila]MDO6453153.1 hypothetical protein [Neptunomonas phycophila]MDO6784406.1 hypothetical protein [Neptunomonas phycophila]
MTEPMVNVPLYDIAHSRAGDKGDRLNLSLILFDQALWPWILESVTADRVKAQFSDRSPSHVERYVLPQLCAMNFVIDQVLEGGVNRSLALDRHGKTLSYHLLAIQISIPKRLAPLR